MSAVGSLTERKGADMTDADEQQLTAAAGKVAKRKPAEEDIAAFKDLEAAKKERPPLPRITLVEGKMNVEHPDKQAGWFHLRRAFGCCNHTFLVTSLSQMFNAANGNERAVNQMVEIVRSVKPEDEIQAAMAVQMATAHYLAMDTAGLASKSQDPDISNSRLNMTAKLMTAFGKQVEALKRHRGRTEQRVVVEHVHVHEGGQAIVGAVEGGGERK